MNRFIEISTYLVFFALVSLVCFREAEAALNISVSPVMGGSSLRFDRVLGKEEVSREVRIRVTSTDATSYQVYQRQMEPFSNNRGVMLSRDVLAAYTLLGSNSAGTLYAQTVEPVGSAEQLLYSSSTGGQSDNFTVAYILRGENIGVSGDFFSRLQFTARPVGGASQSDVILNVTFEIPDELRVEIEGSATPDTIRLKSKSEQDNQAHVRFAFEESPGQEIRFLQDIDVLPQDQSLNEINRDLVLFTTSGNLSGEAYPGVPTPLARREQEIYRSKAGKDTFYVTFQLDNAVLDRQAAGTYNGQLTYRVEAGSVQKQSVIDLEIVVDPVFTLDVDLPPEGLSFQRLLPNSQPELREVGVEVKSNLGHPYMVMQNIISPLTNEKGQQIPSEYFTMKVEPQEDVSGKSEFGNFQQVPLEDHLIYRSDPNGSPSRFKVVYRLRPYSGMVPGNYATAMRFSLGEI